MKRRILSFIAILMYGYGKAGAGMVSRHGSYEEMVPEILQK